MNVYDLLNSEGLHWTCETPRCGSSYVNWNSAGGLVCNSCAAAVTMGSTDRLVVRDWLPV